MSNDQEVRMPGDASGLLEAIPAAACLVSAQDLRIVAHNRRFVALLAESYRRGEALGALVTQAAPAAIQPHLEHALVEIKRTGQAQPLGNTPLQMADGSWWEGQVESLRDAQGEIVWHVITLLDASRRVEAEQNSQELTAAAQLANERLIVSALQAQESAEMTEQARREVQRQASESDAVFTAIADVVLVYDEQQHIIKANPAAQTTFGFDPRGLDSAELANRLALRHLDGRPAALESAPSTLALAGRVTQSRSYRLRIDEHRERICQVSAAPFALGNGRLGAVSVWREITEREQLLQELKRKSEQLALADQRKDEFLAVLGHELRNPLAAITNSCHVLERTAHALPRPASQLVAIISRQSKQLARMVDDLLDVSRFTRGRIALQRQRVDLAEVIQQAVEASRAHFEAQHQELSIELPSEPLFADVDPARIQQVLCNLLHNAAKYTAPGGHIAIAAERGCNGHVLRVKDTGVGIPPALLEEIFEPFTQLGRSLTSSRGGLGIGLTLASNIARLHGGRIEAQSRGEGYGSEFSVYLPACPTASAEAQAAEELCANGAAPRRHVLIVEDQPDLAETMGMLIELLGHHSEVANTGEAAIEAVLARRHDVVLLDIGLPDIDGYEVARRLRARLPDSQSPTLIAFTGFGQESDRLRGEEAGIARHLVKPVDVDTLRTVLEA